MGQLSHLGPEKLARKREYCTLDSDETLCFLSDSADRTIAGVQSPIRVETLNEVSFRQSIHG